MSSAPGIAIPGSNVPASSPVSPGGAQGVQGILGPKGPAPYTVTTADFIMPVSGATVIVNVQDASWVIVGEMLTVQTAGGNPTTAASLRCTAKVGNQLTLLYQPPTTIPLASPGAAGLMSQLSGLPTDYVGGDNACHDTGSLITSVRLRSFNSVGNPNFDVDQINVGNVVANANGKIIDRWVCGKSGSATLAFSAGQVPQTVPGAVYVPGTNFRLSAYCLAVTLTTQQTTLASNDWMGISQNVEGIQTRELLNDVTSIGLLVQSTVAPLKFAVTIRDSAPSRSLAKLCTIPVANTWTYIQLPNLPAFASGGSWALTPGLVGYQVWITLAAGTGQTPAANDTWQTSGLIGALGQDNFASKPVNSVFYVGFVQHEPGPLCTTLIDKPFTQNYDECLRYFQKSYQYSTKNGTVDANGEVGNSATQSSAPYGPYSWKKTMAKAPTVVGYSPNTGSSNAIRNVTGSVDIATTGAITVGDSGFLGFTLSSYPSTVYQVVFHYTADTGW